MNDLPVSEPFSEKGFYLSEFRGRSLALAAPGELLADAAGLARLLEELAANRTRVLLISDDGATAAGLAGAPAIEAAAERLEGTVWRALAGAPHAAVHVGAPGQLAAASRDVVRRLGIGKLLWLDREGGLRRPDAGRVSFLDLDELRRLLANGVPGESPRRVALLAEIEHALADGVAAVNLCTLEGLGDELFTYSGSGTLFTRERYVVVRPLGLDDYDAAHALVLRGVEEGYLAPRPPTELELVLAHGFGAFVEGHHLAGIGALLSHPGSQLAEIASLYTLTRFVGEGIGGHLVRHAIERARELGRVGAFACTTSERVARFFAQHGFEPVAPEELPASKWEGYDPERRRRLHCMRHRLA